MLLIKYLLLALCVPVLHCNASTTLKGNLLFHDVGDRQLNQEHVTFSREVDPSDLDVFAKTLKSSAVLYSNFCTTVSNMTERTNGIDMIPTKIYIIGSTAELGQAQPECHKRGAVLPEARTKKELRYLEDLMSLRDISEVRMGAYYDKTSNTIRYDSDKEPVKNSNLFHTVYYGGSYAGKWHAANWESDSYLTSELQNYPLTYIRTEDGIKLNVLDSNKLHKRHPIICQRISTPDTTLNENKLLLKLVAHSCDRDLHSILAETNSALAEINTITQFHLNLSNTEGQLNNFLPKINYREKRDLGSIGSVSLFGTIFGGAGYILKSIIDAVTGKSKYANKEDVVKIAHEMDSLRINQVQLQKVSSQMESAIHHLEDRMQGVMMATTSMHMESEIKSLNRHLQSVLGLTLLRYSAALMAARDKKTHPYALSQTELIELSTTYFKLHRVLLDTDTNNVQTSVLVSNETIIFLFAIPIIQQDKFFNFYTIIRLPTFSSNDTYWPDTDTTNIAISKNGDKYTTLTPNEMQSCLNDPPVCTSNKPIFPMSNQALCVVSTYITGTSKCPLKAASMPPQPFLHFQGNQLFFSVPNNTLAYVKCQKSTLSNEYTEKTVSLQGIGQGEYKPSCTINLPDGTSYKTPSDKVVTKLKDWPIFHLHQALPHDVETTVDLHNRHTNFTIEQTSMQNQSPFEFVSEYTKADIIGLTVSTLIPILVMIAVAGCWYYRRNNNGAPHFLTHPYTDNIKHSPTQVWFANTNNKAESPILRTTHL